MSNQKFYAGQPVLVRNFTKDEIGSLAVENTNSHTEPPVFGTTDVWEFTFYGRHDSSKGCQHITISGEYLYCIPYEGNEHYLGTNNDFKTSSELKFGDYILGWDDDDGKRKYKARFCHYDKTNKDDEFPYKSVDPEGGMYGFKYVEYYDWRKDDDDNY